MKGILGALWQLEETKMLLDGALAHRRPRLTGVSSVHRAMLCAAIRAQKGQKLLVRCSAAPQTSAL